MGDYRQIPASELSAILASPYAPKSLAGRQALADQLLAPLCVDEDGNEYVGPPMIDAAGYLAIVSGGSDAPEQRR